MSRQEQNTRVRPKPFTLAMLDDIEGGQEGLLPRSTQGIPLKVEFAPWTNTDPTPEFPESVELFWNGRSVDIKRWTAPIASHDYYINVPPSWLTHGCHKVEYILTLGTSQTEPSEVRILTVDTEPPLLNSSSQLIFPSEVLPPNKLTAHYLEQHEDQLKADIPGYTTPRPWDRITWFWGSSPGDLNQGDIIELDDKNYSEPLVLTVPGQLIRDRGDGLRYVTYQVHDRAGNASVYSVAVELDVAATPIPRVLPWPSVEKAAGEGEQQTLDPLQAINGVIVQVPENAVIYPGEQVWVQWGEPGTLGATRVEQPISSGSRRYQVDMNYVAAHIGRTLSVAYGVIDPKEQEHNSVSRKLQVQTIPSNRLKAVQCNGLSGGNLSYRTVEDKGARLTLEKWPLMTTDHWVMITMTGVNSSGLDSPFEAVKKRAVTEQETFAGIGFGTEVKVPKAFLNTLQRNRPLTGKVYVSFDGGKTWPPLPAPNFPLLQLTFID